MLGNFSCVLSSADLFSKSSFSKNSFSNTISVSNSLDQHFVGPDLNPNCVCKDYQQTTLADRVKKGVVFRKKNSLTSPLKHFLW